MLQIFQEKTLQMVVTRIVLYNLKMRIQVFLELKEARYYTAS